MRAASTSGAIALLASCVSCANSEDDGRGVRVSVAPSIVAPLSVLDDAQTVAVYAFDDASGATCDATTGLAMNDGQRLDLTTATGQTELSPTGCTVAGARFCGTLDLPPSTTNRIFQVIAYSNTDAELGDGCATAQVTGTAVNLPLISIVRFLQPSVCGDGVVGATEQCEPKLATDTGLCDPSCHTVETVLSDGSDSTMAGQTQSSTSKSDPFLLWPQTDPAGHFLALFTDAPAGHTQIGVRVLGAAMQETMDFGSVAASQFFWLPNDPSGTFPPVETANSQSAPAAALAMSTYFVVFADDANTSDGAPDIHLRSMDLSLVAEQSMGAPVGINGDGGGGEAEKQFAPAIAAGPGALLLVGWIDASTSTAVVRTVAESGLTLGTQHVLGAAASADSISVAATTTGWLVAWTDSGNVRLQALSSAGAAMGSVVTVNTASAGSAAHARVASLPDGRYAVTWSATGGSSGADVFVQRYATSGTPVTGDTAAPVHDVSSTGDQSDPTIAPLTADGGSFAVAWVDEPTGEIHARYLGGSSGYLYNNVDGQDDEFVATAIDGRTRAEPTIAQGGSGPYVAFGWQDTTTANSAIITARRFPLPP